jgi:hypothetical protein
MKNFLQMLFRYVCNKGMNDRWSINRGMRANREEWSYRKKAKLFARQFKNKAFTMDRMMADKRNICWRQNFPTSEQGGVLWFLPNIFDKLAEKF